MLENNNVHSIVYGDSILIIKKFPDRNTVGVIVGEGIWTEISLDDTKFFDGIEETDLRNLKRRPITSLFASKRMINAANTSNSADPSSPNPKKKDEKKRAFSVSFFRKSTNISHTS